MNGYMIALALVIILLVTLWLLWDNKRVQVTTISMNNHSLPESFRGFKIAHISDFHNRLSIKDKVIDKLSEAAPDMIVISGDLIDAYRTDIETSLDFVRQVLQFAPVYYVTGNHESRVAAYAGFRLSLQEAGVHLLEDEGLLIYRQEETILLMGIDDPSFNVDKSSRTSADIVNEKLEKLVPADSHHFTILLSHRPELFDVYVKHKLQLVVSGHAHGGQVRIPFIGGLFAPNQGFFPAYTKGLYMQGETSMVVSCGLGHSIIPLRVNNPAELVIVTLDR